MSGKDSSKVSGKIEKIVPAAYHGRLEIMFVTAGHRIWGFFEPEKNIVVGHDKKEAQDEDLLNIAVIHTIINGGKVYTVNPKENSIDGEVAAIFRY